MQASCLFTDNMQVHARSMQKLQKRMGRGIGGNEKISETGYKVPSTNRWYLHHTNSI